MRANQVALGFEELVLGGVEFKAAADAFFAPLDVAGYNYSPQLYTKDHDRVPARVMVATETFPAKTIDDWRYASTSRCSRH